MAITMIAQTLNTNGTWTLVASGPITNILLVGPAGGWEVYVSTTLPSPSNVGLPSDPLDGAWGSSSTALAAGENVYARPFGKQTSNPVIIKGMVN